MRFEMTETQTQLEGERVRSLGIRCGDAVVEDVARDPAVLRPLVDLCNELRLSPEQLRDVAEDFAARLTDWNPEPWPLPPLPDGLESGAVAPAAAA